MSGGLVPLKTNATPSGSLFGAGGGGAGPNLSVSSLTINNFSANPNGALAFTYDFSSQLNTLPVNSVGLTQAVVKDSAGNNTNSLISFVNNGGSNLTTDFASARVHVGAQGTGSSATARGTIAYDGTANLMTFSPASISSLSVSSINGAVPGGAIPEDLTVNSIGVSSISVSSINGLVFSPVPNMNWGAVNIPASGSTIASVADSPYSGSYYQQLTYRGNVQASLSSLFASSINGSQFMIYGEPGQQVMYFTIGN